MKIISALLAFILAFQVPAFSSETTFSASEDDRQLLRKIQKDTFQYFLDNTHPESGLTFDSSRSGAPVSIAATGFALASFAIATSNGWLTYKEAYKKIEKTVDSLERKVQHEQGFFYHFVDAKTGKRAWSSEASSIDTALLLAGALIAASYFSGTDLEARIKTLYRRVNWNWMRNGTDLMCHGWKPSQGFLPYYWDMYSEHLILQALAAGAENNAVPASVWKGWERKSEPFGENEIIYSYTGSLFTYQFSQAFIDFRTLRDGGIDYFNNSTLATLANKKFCELNQGDYQTYREGYWGLSASLGPDGYQAYGAEPGVGMHDGTIAPYAVVGSLLFAPDEAMPLIRNMYEKYGDRLYGPYGFKDAFNLDRNWWAGEYLGIDQGLIVLSIENFLNDGQVWKRFMRLSFIERWMERTGVLKVTA